MELRVGGLEHYLRGLEILLQELIANTKSRSSYWQKHTEKNRPVGEAEIGLWLREGLIGIAGEFFTTSTEREKLKWVGFVLKAPGVRYPDEKKNKKRFVGRSPAPTNALSEQAHLRLRSCKKATRR
jgi:hypothetical protein